jgi:2-oxoisovalerate dehydrogenase E1 component alpha subunit
MPHTPARDDRRPGEKGVTAKRKVADQNGVAVAAREIATGSERLPADRCLQIYRIMVRARAMEERMIKMSKSGEGYFWIGGPGEEAFNVVLGLQVKKGQGPDHDYLHLHYRNSATMVAMGMPLIDGIRQMAMTLTDPHSMGRNFAGHFARRDWNIVPVSSPVENQLVVAPGTAWVQRRHGGDGITIVTGGDAGTAEGDFASCLVWSSRPGNELPILIVVTNNGWGISTSACSQHGEKLIIDRAKAFGIPGEVVDGKDVVASWFAVRRAMEHCRRERKPYMLEAMVSRLHGHSSSSGAIRVKEEPDCIQLLEEKLRDAGAIDQEAIDQMHEAAKSEAEGALEQAMKERRPTIDDVKRFTYGPSHVDAVYPEDYTGLPQQEAE